MQNKALKPCHKLSPINTYVVAEKEWDTKEDKRVHDVCVVVAAVGKKGKSRVEAMPNSEVIKPVALKCDWILEKRSKSHIGSSEINGFKELKPA